MIYDFFITMRGPISIGKRFLVSLILLSFVFVAELWAASVNLLFDSNVPQAVFTAEDIRATLKAEGHIVRQLSLKHLSRIDDSGRIVLSLKSNDDIINVMQSEGAKLPGILKSEGYSIRTSSRAGRTSYWVIGADSAGVMYGGLELAEVVRVDGLDGVKDVEVSLENNTATVEFEESKLLLETIRQAIQAQGYEVVS